MKKIASILIGSLILACSSPDSNSIGTELINNPNTAVEGSEDFKMPELKFEEESFDFGDISQGEKVSHSFNFVNEGEGDLLISSATGSCGCTVPSYPKEPIKPGQSAEIMVVFDSNGKKGAQHKRVTVVSNTNPNKSVVAIMANVLVPEEN